jgi:pimeloyl-ACP methyl ester carboxylesterase
MLRPCIRAALAAGLLQVLVGGCVQAQPLFASGALPGASAASPVPTLQREALQPPLRFRVIVLPGSGCSGMAPVAVRYFAGLLHAQVLVLHKPGTDLQAGLMPTECPDGFVQRDSLARWQAHASAALRADALARAGLEPLPTVLVGISEGAELLPGLAAEVPHLAGLVLLSGSGLDPLEAGAMQAQRLGQLPAWQVLDAAQRSDAPDSDIVQGRSLRYWRDLWRWRVTRPLLESPWPILQAWGDADALVPPLAYQSFAERAQGRSGPFCTLRISGADHGLQQSGADGVQRLWAWLENWARAPAQGLCGVAPP